MILLLFIKESRSKDLISRKTAEQPSEEGDRAYDVDLDDRADFPRTPPAPVTGCLEVLWKIT
ncbi:hypothetical protein N7533_003131 [Penicillium manginii]|jgi:hypothetical protein|uniref:uncharacterized protein n=1 Tax=Penicillium manginii TaxID=203109 RepID=UPI00254707C1|nr:uncharacterized protein N7533_003131 [Penicillium manginii]KAJ5764450.1 hypothetical protein N7533_003131 [Penicillium manginii]